MSDIDDRLDRLESQLEQQQGTIEEHQETIERQRERNVKLKSRLDRIEAHVGIDAAGQQGMADDWHCRLYLGEDIPPPAGLKKSARVQREYESPQSASRFSGDGALALALPAGTHRVDLRASTAALDVTYTVDNETVAVDETVTVTATVSNTGEASGGTDVTFYADGEMVDNSTETVDAGNATTVEFTTSFERTRRHNVTMKDLNATDITVEEEETVEHESGVWQALYGAAAGDDGDLSRSEVIDLINSYINSQSVDGIPVSRPDVIDLINYYIDTST